MDFFPQAHTTVQEPSVSHRALADTTTTPRGAREEGGEEEAQDSRVRGFITSAVKRWQCRISQRQDMDEAAEHSAGESFAPLGGQPSDGEPGLAGGMSQWLMDGQEDPEADAPQVSSSSPECDGEDDGTCSICLDDLHDEPVQPVVWLSCGHTFHKRCVHRWQYSSSVCPVCRQPYQWNEEKIPCGPFTVRRRYRPRRKRKSRRRRSFHHDATACVVVFISLAIVSASGCYWVMRAPPDSDDFVARAALLACFLVILVIVSVYITQE